MLLENWSDFVINGNIIDGTSIESKYGKENDKKQQDSFHDNGLWG
jgi:hypothetical protein